jgi:glycerol-3-phosphate dehydrogenase
MDRHAQDPTRLGPAARRRALQRLASEPFDVLVVGGGVTGAGAALDAATRGLRVALIERRDVAAGSSSRSTKLIHGGLRYLEQRNFGLVQEALRERRLLLETVAPHLVRPLSFLLPLRVHWEREYFGAGVLLYDVLGGFRPAVPRHRHLTHSSAAGLAPALRDDAYVGAIRYGDAQMDDARFVVALLRTAMAHGAVVATGVAAEGFQPRAGGRAAVLTVRDTVDPRADSFDVQAGAVVNATGVWAADMERLAGVAQPVSLRASKGVHVLVPRAAIDSSVGLTLRTEKSVLLVVPWKDHWLIGTTDTPWDLDREHPAATAADVRYLLDRANDVLRRPLTTDDVTGVFVGLRPLVAPETVGDTARVSREHVVRTPLPGLVSIVGGKYTTYRVMARDAIDAAAAQLDVPVAESRTQSVPLLGAEGLPTARARVREAAPDAATAERLLSRYGARASELLALMASDPALAAPIPGTAYAMAEALYAVTHEGALMLDDVLSRRTRSSIEAADRGRAAAEPVARLIAPELGWSRSRIKAEVARYHQRLDAELAAQAALDDDGADAARRAVRDPRIAA